MLTRDEGEYRRKDQNNQTLSLERKGAQNMFGLRKDNDTNESAGLELSRMGWTRQSAKLET